MKECTFTRFQRLRESDRRIKARHSAPCLGITVRKSGFLNVFYRPVEAQCIDINRYGIALECEEFYRAGDKVCLDFQGKYICQSNIRATVSSVQRVNGRRRYGMIFNYCTDSRHYSREEDNALSRIESLYNEQYQMKVRNA